MSKMAQSGNPELNGVQVSPLFVVLNTAISVPIYIVPGNVGSTTSTLTGISGSRPTPVPLMSVHVAIPIACTLPRQTCGEPKPDITTIMVLSSPGSVAISQIYRCGSGEAE